MVKKSMFYTNLQKWQTRSDDKKNFHNTLGFIVDQPKQCHGSTNDDNSGRRFFNWYWWIYYQTILKNSKIWKIQYRNCLHFCTTLSLVLYVNNCTDVIDSQFKNYWNVNSANRTNVGKSAEIMQCLRYILQVAALSVF